LQEVARKTSRACDRISETIEYKLTNDLVKSGIQGDVVVVSGLVI
jgi:hypothetical protein